MITVGDQVVIGFDRPRLERLLEADGRRKVVFGAAVADAAPYMAKRGLVPVFGALVGKVSPGSPADRAGLAPGDIITGLGLRTIANAEGVEQALANVEPGGRLTVTFQRGDKSISREVVF